MAIEFGLLFAFVLVPLIVGGITVLQVFAVKQATTFIAMSAAAVAHASLLAGDTQDDAQAAAQTAITANASALLSATATVTPAFTFTPQGKTTTVTVTINASEPAYLPLPGGGNVVTQTASATD